MADFGENLRRIRLERNMTQDEFAELLDTSKQVISRYENGQRSPKVSTVATFARLLRVPSSALTGIGDEEDDEDREMWEYREQLRRDPNRRILFSLSKNGSKKDVEQAVAIIDALRRTNPDFYDDQK